MDLREKLTAIIESGKEAERALEKLEMLEKAESENATVDDLRQAVAIAEGEKDFETAGILKNRWIQLRRGGAQ